MDSDFRTEFVRLPAGLKNRPTLVLNAGYRPLSYYPLSLWSWWDAVKAKYLDRVDIVAEYDNCAHSPTTTLRIPSVVVLKDYIRAQKRVVFTRFNLFLRDEFCYQYCGSKEKLTFDHVIPRAAGGVTGRENKCAVVGVLFNFFQYVGVNISRVTTYTNAILMFARRFLDAIDGRCSPSLSARCVS